MKRAGTIIAETFGCDVRDVAEYRYQPTRLPITVYAIGERYFTVGATKPIATAMRFKWEPHADQFFASQANTTLWVASADDEPDA